MFDFCPAVLVKFAIFCQQINKGYISVNFYEPEGVCHLASKHLQHAYMSNLDLVGFSAVSGISSGTVLSGRYFGQPIIALGWLRHRGVLFCRQRYSLEIAVEQITPDF